MNHCILIDWQCCYPVCLALQGQVVGGRGRERQLAQFVFDDGFPNRAHAEEHIVGRILNCDPMVRRQTRIGGDVPKEGVSVEEQFHRSTLLITSENFVGERRIEVFGYDKRSGRQTEGSQDGSGNWLSVHEFEFPRLGFEQRRCPNAEFHSTRSNAHHGDEDVAQGELFALLSGQFENDSSS